MDGEVREFDDSARALKAFSVNHSFPILPLEERKDNSSGYFFPPHFAFLPAELRSLKAYDVFWLYALWHELQHMEDTAGCNLGIYEEMLYGLSETLMTHGMYEMTRNNIVEFEHCTSKSVNILTKINLFSAASKVSKEVHPTYLQLSEITRHDIADLIYDMAPKFFENVSTPVEEYHLLVDAIGDDVVNRMKSKEEKTCAGIREEHLVAFLFGDAIYRRFKKIEYIDQIPLMAMNIDLSRTDLLEMTVQDLQKEMKEKPEELMADYRLTMLIKEGERSINQKRKSMIRNQKILDNITKILCCNSGLPKDLLDMYRQIWSKEAPSRRDNTTGAKSIQNKVDRRKLFKWSTDKGDIFFFIPITLREKERYVQITLFNTYVYELMLRANGLSKCPQDFLLSIRDTLNQIAPVAPKPELNHKLVESILGKIYGKDFLSRLF